MIINIETVEKTPLAKIRLFEINGEYFIAPKNCFWPPAAVIAWYEKKHYAAIVWKIRAFTDRPAKGSKSFYDQMQAKTITDLAGPKRIDFD